MQRSVSRLALVAMPWSTLSQPSAPLGALAPYVRQHIPDLPVACFSEFIEVGLAVGQAVYELIAGEGIDRGELFYMPLLYPEKKASVEAWFREWWPRENMPESTDDVWHTLSTVLPQHLEETAQRLVAGGYDVVAMTTSFCQLWANLALAQRLKALAPNVTIVMGGPTLSSRVGPSIQAEYPYVDFIVQGEGERPLTQLLRDIRQGGDGHGISGVLAQGVKATGKRLSEVEALDQLPYPDFDEYAEKADAAGLNWALPLEGSRGCWWDRVIKTGNPKATCYFCNQNMQWSGYREKTVERIASELRDLSRRYERANIFFLDNIIRHRDTEKLARRVGRLRGDYHIFHEMRVNVTPYEMLLLWEAGLEEVQFGIEGLSTRFLKRIGKGTTALQNLQAMKICAELGIKHTGNLITEFPGATAAEVEETRDVITRYGIIYEPLRFCTFSLGIDSTVERLPNDFGIRRLRNWDRLQVGLPDDVWARVEYLYLSYDSDEVSWDPVRKACQVWDERYAEMRKPLLSYRDLRTYLQISDSRVDSVNRFYTLNGLTRDVYLACTEAIRDEDLKRRLCPDGQGEAQVDAALRQLLDLDILYAEDGRYLSLAVAASPRAAARRIRAAHNRKHRAVGSGALPEAHAPGADADGERNAHRRGWTEKPPQAARSRQNQALTR